MWVIMCVFKLLAMASSSRLFLDYPPPPPVRYVLAEIGPACTASILPTLLVCPSKYLSEMITTNNINIEFVQSWSIFTYLPIE